MATVAFTAAPQSLLNAAMVLTVNSAVAFNAGPVSQFDAIISLTGGTAAMMASPVSSFDAVVDLSGRSAAFGARPISELHASVALSGSLSAFRAAPLSALVGSVTLNGNAGSFSARPLSEFAGSVDLTGASDSYGLTVCEVVSDILNMWGMFCRKSAPTFALNAAINIVNQSLQLVWNNADGRTYWTNDTVTITLADTESSQDLATDIQNVTGPCRLASSKQPLVPIGTIGELEMFSDLYMDGSGADTQVAYHVERTAQAGGDPARCIFHVNSAIVGADVAFLLEVVKEAPRFFVNDLSSCPVVPIPHRYVESLLLPVARYHASVFHLFRKGDQKDTIDREYQQAMVLLGLADPLPGNAGDNKKGEPAK